jgi:hypothetical protein
MQIGMPQANALKPIGYTDTILFLTIGKTDIYQHKSVGKSATVFYPGDQKLPKLAADLPNLFCEDIRLTNIRRLHIYHITNSWEEYCIRISYRFYMHLQAAFLFAQEIGKFLALTALDLLSGITQ